MAQHKKWTKPELLSRPIQHVDVTRFDARLCLFLGLCLCPHEAHWLDVPRSEPVKLDMWACLLLWVR